MSTRLMVPLISSVFNISLDGIFESYRRIDLPSSYDSWKKAAFLRTVLDEWSDPDVVFFGDRILSNVTFLLPEDVLPLLDVLLLFRSSELPLLRRMPLIGWLCDDLGEDVRLPAQLTSNQVTLPENEEAEVFAMVPAIANREGC